MSRSENPYPSQLTLPNGKFSLIVACWITQAESAHSHPSHTCTLTCTVSGISLVAFTEVRSQWSSGRSTAAERCCRS